MTALVSHVSWRQSAILFRLICHGKSLEQCVARLKRAYLKRCTARCAVEFSLSQIQFWETLGMDFCRSKAVRNAGRMRKARCGVVSCEHRALKFIPRRDSTF